MDPLHPDPIRRVELAMEDLRAGRAIILVDDEDRENEGDIVVAAEKVTPEHINFMALHARGLICLTLTNDQVQKLALPMMATNNQSQFQTAFTVSIEAREGVTTGISAADRALTVHAAIAPDANPRSVVTPGHMFPLRARDGGVLERVGQTEGSVDLARLAGLNPSGVICEIIKEDGTMARMPDLIEFGKTHGIRIATVADIIKYRMQRERVVRREAEGHVEVPGIGTFRTVLYRSLRTDGLHLAYTLGDANPDEGLVRVQAAAPPWAFLNADVSRTAQSALAALKAIADEGSGALVCMHASMGTLDQLQHSFERDFADAGQAPAQPSAEALRDLGTGCQILVDLGYKNLRILTSSARPIVGVEAYGLHIIEKVPL
ncbi:MAG: 3,4-dihydroxy-2-butanone-4-phosphate synthase [Deltaproteobacteria bacterium]|nr:MAG: 3,4-dihydroxy-2-butanone-4-phosphate synthase [Deltaproteobacteria bacterium]